MNFSTIYLAEAQRIAAALDPAALERMVALLARVRARGGRLFLLGVGGSAANASHAVNDFRKICGFEAYAPTDNVSELTARAADACVVIPTVSSERVTPHSEAFQAVVWHLLVSHPKLKKAATKWESAVKRRSCRAR